MTELQAPLLAGTLPWTALLSVQTQILRFCTLQCHLAGASAAVFKTGLVISHLAVLLLDQALRFLDVFMELLDVAGLRL